MYGWRARIGRITPSAGVVSENEWAGAAPDGVAIVSARYYIERLTKQDVERMVTEVDRAARELASARVDVIVQAGSPAVFVHGEGYDRQLIDAIEKATSVPATTSALSAVEAMRRLGIGSVTVVTAYTDDLNEHLQAYLERAGIVVTAIQGLGILQNASIGDQPQGFAYRLGRDILRRSPSPADGIFISCGELPTFDVIDALEEDLGVPVVTTSQAAFWNGLRLAGVRAPIRHLGRLLTM